MTSKAKIVELIHKGVYSYDPEMITCLRNDYSQDGIGWMLQQKI